MEKKNMKTLLSVTLVLALMAISAWGFTRNCKAATYGWNSNKNGVYFIKDNGKPYQGFMKYNGQWFYFIPETGYMLTGWQWSEKENSPIRYFSKQDGHMYTGWHTDNNGNKRYFDKSKGLMAKGWVKNSKGQYRYFSKKTGIMAVGWVKNSAGEYRYFSKSSGIMYTGWITTSEGTRFFDRNNGIMAQNVTIWIDGSFHKFNAKGIDVTEPYLY